MTVAKETKKAKKTPKAKAGAAVKAVPVQRYVAPSRVEERLAQGWTRVEGQPALRNGSVLMEKKA